MLKTEDRYMKLKIKLFLWQLWLTLVVWAVFFYAVANGAEDFWITVVCGFIALYLVYAVLCADFSTHPSDSDGSETCSGQFRQLPDYPYLGFFGTSPEIADLIQSLAGLSSFFGAVHAGLISLVAYSIFDDEYVAMAALEGFVLLLGFVVLGVNDGPSIDTPPCYKRRDYISNRYFYTYLVIGSLLIVAPMLWYLFTHQEQIKATLGS